jgi:5-methylcytosine-specific restriction endonuclease McrA
MKTCAICQQEKAYDLFPFKKNRHGNPYYAAICKSCRAESARMARRNNPEAVRAADRLRNSKKTAEQKKRQAEYLVEWRRNNKDKIAASRTKDVVQKYSKTWYEKHKDAIKTKVSEYRKKNPEKVRALNQSRRGLERTGKLSPDIIERLLAIQKGLCVCCRKKLGKDFHLDHIIPLSLGGSNTDENMQLLKAKCNLQKNAKHPVDFMRERGFLL